MRRWRGGVGVLHDKQAVGIRAQRDGVLFERLQDAAAQFAEDRVLLVDADADADRIGDDATGDGVDAGAKIHAADTGRRECRDRRLRPL